MRDVLIFTPVKRLEAQTVQALMALEWPGPLSLLYQRDNPTGSGPMDHLHQYQRGREIFLSWPYEAMLIIESDIVPPPDTLLRLAELDVDVAYGCYVFRTPGPKVVNVFERYPQPARNVGESLSCHPGLWQAALRRGIVDCSGGGLGCVLVRRRVLEEVEFRTEKNPDGASYYFCDNYWTDDVHRGGYSMKASTLVLCGHVDVDGQVYYPEAAA